MMGALAYVNRDNQRFIGVALGDDDPAPERTPKPRPAFRVRSFYKYELAEWYDESLEYFNQYYLHVPAVLIRLADLGYDPKKTRKLSPGMVRVIIDIHGEPQV